MGYDEKEWYESRGVLGSIATVIVGILSTFGVNIDIGIATDVAVGAAATITGVITLIGRTKADKRIR